MHRNASAQTLNELFSHEFNDHKISGNKLKISWQVDGRTWSLLLIVEMIDSCSVGTGKVQEDMN